MTDSLYFNPIQSFGLHGNSRENVVSYQESNGGDKLIFPSSGGCVMYDVRTKTSTFLEPSPDQLVHNSPPTSLALNPIQTHIAIATSAADGEGGLVTIHKISGSSKKPITLLNRSRIKSMTFSTKRLICACKDSLSVWLWQANKLEFSAALSTNINRVCQSSSDDLFATVGQGHCRLWIASKHHRLTNTKLTETESIESKNHYQDCAWLKTKSDDDGLLFAVLTMPLKKNEDVTLSVIDKSQTQVQIVKIVDGITSARPRVEQMQKLDLNVGGDAEFTVIQSFQSSCGFAVTGGTLGRIILFEKYENDKFVQSRIISQPSVGRIFSMESCRQDEEKMIVYAKGWIGYLRITELDDQHEKCEEVLSNWGHEDGVVDFDCSTEKAIIASCGIDGCIKVWDTDKNQCLLSSSDDSDISRASCLSVHPSGLQLAVGFLNKLVLFHICIDGLCAYRETQTKSPVSIVKYSEGGHYLAVAIGSSITVYRVFKDYDHNRFSTEISFVGHSANVTSLVWSGSKLLSCATDRNIFVWDIESGARLENLNVLRSYGSCTSLAVKTTPAFIKAAALTVDGAIHKIMWTGRSREEGDSNIICMACPENKITTICVNNNGEYLFACNMDGTLRCYEWLSDEPKILFHYTLHVTPCGFSGLPNEGAVTKLAYGRNMLISAGKKDGSIFLGNVSALKSPVPHQLYSSKVSDDVVLVKLESYNELKEQILELQGNIEALRTDHKFALESTEARWKDEQVQMEVILNKSIEEERKKHVDLETQLKESNEKHTRQLELSNLNEATRIQELENNYEQKLAACLKQQKDLENRIMLQEESQHDDVKNLKKTYERKLEELRKEDEAKIRTMQSKINQLEFEQIESEKVFKEILEQEEEEYELQLVQMKAKSLHETKLLEIESQEMKRSIRNLDSKKKQLLRSNEELRSKATHSDDCFQNEYEIRKKIQRKCEEKEADLQRIEKLLDNKTLQMEELSMENNSLGKQIESLCVQKNQLIEERGKDSEEFRMLKEKIRDKEHSITLQKLVNKERDLKIENQCARLSTKNRQIAQLQDQVRALKREMVVLASMEGEKLNKALGAMHKKYVT